MEYTDTLITLAEQQARNVLLVLREAALMPTWVIIDSKGQPHIHATPWENELEKKLAGVMIRVELRRLKARAYSFVTEAWSRQAPPDWDPSTPIPEHERPMNNPDREEVVIAFASDGKQKISRRWKIRRDWNEQIVGLEPSGEWQEGTFEGWMTDML